MYIFFGTFKGRNSALKAEIVASSWEHALEKAQALGWGDLLLLQEVRTLNDEESLQILREKLDGSNRWK